MHAVLANSADWDATKLVGVFERAVDAVDAVDKINQCTYTRAWIQEVTLNPVLTNLVTIHTIKIMNNDFDNLIRHSYKTILELEDDPSPPKIQKIGDGIWYCWSQDPTELETLLKEIQESV